MRMPDEVYATLSAVVQRYPHTGSDEDRRAAMERAVATIRARHGVRWVWKTEHESLIAPSKDGLGYVVDGERVINGRLTPMFIWDTINGSSRQVNTAPLMSEEPRPAYVLAVEPKDWLTGAGVPIVVSPPPDPDTDTHALLEAIAVAFGSLEVRLARLEQKVDAAAALPFPLYTGGFDFLGRRLTITLEPQK